MLEVEMRLRELGGESGPACIKHIRRLADAFAPQQPTDHVPESLGLGSAFVALETISPGPLDMREHGQRAAAGMRQQFRRQRGEEGLERNFPRLVVHAVEVVNIRSAPAITREKDRSEEHTS